MLLRVERGLVWVLGRGSARNDPSDFGIVIRTRTRTRKSCTITYHRPTWLDACTSRSTRRSSNLLHSPMKSAIINQGHLAQPRSRSIHLPHQWLLHTHPIL